VDLPEGEKQVRWFHGSKRFQREATEMADFPKKPLSQDTPIEQLYAILVKYISGQKLNTDPLWSDLKIIRPHENGVWEFRTTDLRIFGWFIWQDIFIANSMFDADFLKQTGLSVKSICNETAWFRKSLDLCQPVFVESEQVENVISNQD